MNSYQENKLDLMHTGLFWTVITTWCIITALILIIGIFFIGFAYEKGQASKGQQSEVLIRIEEILKK